MHELGYKMPWCKCGSVWPHAAYAAHNAMAKNQQFNAWVVHRMAHLDPRAHVVVLDTGALGTTRALRSAGHHHITAVTWCRRDFAVMQQAALPGVICRHDDIQNVYAEMAQRHVVAVDDGMQTAAKTLPRFKTLLACRPASIAIALNIVPRGNVHGSMHRDFLEHLCALAHGMGYSTVCAVRTSYSQTTRHHRGATMWPHWVEFK